MLRRIFQGINRHIEIIKTVSRSGVFVLNFLRVFYLKLYRRPFKRYSSEIHPSDMAVESYVAHIRDKSIALVSEISYRNFIQHLLWYEWYITRNRNHQ